MDTTDKINKRSTNELLKILLDNIDYVIGGGLCGISYLLALRGTITNEERDDLLEYIHSHRPKNYYYYLDNLMFNKNYGFYWKRGKKKPRIKWIKQQIREL